MSDPQNFREIQLSGKQLVFLFMASVVLAVAVFLLGVSVGRGVGPRATAPESADAEPAEVTPTPEELPAPTETSARDLRYMGDLQEQTAAPAEPPPVVTEPASAPEPAPQAPPDAGPGASGRAATAPPETRPAAPPVTPPAEARGSDSPARPAETAPASRAGTWFVRVDSFRSRENADRRVAQLKDKGIVASVTTNAGLFQVRVGPFPQRADADRTAARLRQEGLKPLVTR
jgi:cell division protein FtsN